MDPDLELTGCKSDQLPEKAKKKKKKKKKRKNLVFGFLFPSGTLADGIGLEQQ